MKLGEELVIRATNERVLLLGILDAGGTLLVGRSGEDPFQLHADEVMTLRERHGCSCC